MRTFGAGILASIETGEDREPLIAAFDQTELRAMLRAWEAQAHPPQLPPPGAWSTWLFLGGRGAGKTRAGAQWLTTRGREAEAAVMGVTASPLPPGPLNRFDAATRLVLRPLADGSMDSWTREQVLGGAGAVAVADGAGAWEVLQYTTAEPTGDGGYVLSGLLRGQLGTADAMTGPPAGAPWVRLGPELARLNVSAGERGLPLLWRAAPAGGPAGGLASSDVTAAWRARAWRPFAPAQARAVRTTAGLRLTWVRCARVGGDAWDGEVPLEEPVERYRVSVLSGAAAGDYVVDAPELALAPADLTTAPYAMAVSIAQWGAMWGGWGGELERTLWL